MLGGITVQRWLQASGGGAVVAHLDKREREIQRHRNMYIRHKIAQTYSGDLPWEHMQH